MSYGIAVTQVGNDAATAAVEEHVFHSDYNAFKIVAEGQVSIDVTNVNESEAIIHGLGYVPGFKAYAQQGSTEYSWPLESLDLYELDFVTTFVGYVNSTQVTLQVTYDGVNYTAVLYYYIIADAAA